MPKVKRLSQKQTLSQGTTWAKELTLKHLKQLSQKEDLRRNRLAAMSVGGEGEYA